MPAVQVRPFAGAASTVDVIREAALKSQNFYNVRELAERIIAGLRSKDYVSEVAAIFNFVKSNVRYARDPRTVELVKAPYVVVDQLQSGQTPSLDCDDMAALLAALCMAVGCEVDITTVAFAHLHYRGQRQYTHVFCRAKEPRTGRWIVLDPVPSNDSRMLARVVAAKHWPIT